jgi:hypothetical protein
VGTDPTETSTRSGIASGTSFRLGVELTCGDLTVGRGSDANWRVSATHAEDEPPVIEGASSSLDVRPSSNTAVFPFTADARSSWDISVPSDPALAVGVTLNFASGDVVLGPGPLDSMGATLNFSDADVDLTEATAAGGSSVGLTANFASAKLRLGEMALTGGITLNFSSLELCIDPDVALRISHEGTLSSDDLDASGLESVADGWQTPGFETAESRISLDITSTFSSIQLDRSGGCP